MVLKGLLGTLLVLCASYATTYLLWRLQGYQFGVLAQIPAGYEGRAAPLYAPFTPTYSTVSIGGIPRFLGLAREPGIMGAFLGWAWFDAAASRVEPSASGRPCSSPDCSAPSRLQAFGVFLVVWVTARFLLQDGPNKCPGLPQAVHRRLRAGGCRLGGLVRTGVRLPGQARLQRGVGRRPDIGHGAGPDGDQPPPLGAGPVRHARLPTGPSTWSLPSRSTESPPSCSGCWHSSGPHCSVASAALPWHRQRSSSAPCSCRSPHALDRAVPGRGACGCHLRPDRTGRRQQPALPGARATSRSADRGPVRRSGQ